MRAVIRRFLSSWRASPIWALGFLLPLAASSARAEIRISEIMYNPPQGGDLQYVELVNSGADSIDLRDWSFVDGVSYRFVPYVLGPGARVVVAENRDALLAARPELDETRVLGPFTGDLSNSGERIALADAAGLVVEAFTFDDDAPWDFLADGFGASLERLCVESPADDPTNWRAGTIPPSPEQLGGTPAAPNERTQCPPTPRTVGSLRLSEIHYHAVLEESLEDRHEFLEVHNASDDEISLEGWRIAGAVDFTFPAGVTLAARGYAVVAKDPDRLSSLPAYGLTRAEVHGPYARELDNGGEKIFLIGPDGVGADSVTYDDEFPWPLAADALGASDNWLAPELLPLEDHRYLGVSLERVRFDVPASEVANWVPSALDGATPGRPNGGARETILPIVSDLRVDVADPVGENDRIGEGDAVRVQVLFSPTAPSGEVRLLYYVEDLNEEDPTVTVVPLVDNGQDGDFVPGDAIYSAILPPQAENSIVRYRVVADRGEGIGGGVSVAPRVDDPMRWRMYFVAPVIETETRVYQLFIGRGPWSRLWTNVTPGRAGGCTANPRWNEREFAIFVHDGEVYDCRVRYQGSRWNRTNGPNANGWRFPGPAAPNPPRGLSWRISLPRYARVGNRNELTLNKLTQGCPGYNSGVGYRLFAAADIPSPRTRFVQLHINGGYMRYMMEYERPAEDMMRRYHDEQSAKYGLPREKVGHLFKSVGCNCDEGPYGWGDYRLLPERCGFSELERYDATYPRKTNEWDDPAALRQLVIDLHEARRQGIPALRSYFAEHFDIDLTLNYMAIMNWSVPFDDMFQNHFIYQRISDGKWLFTPWDLDQNFGEWQGASSSIYMGEQGNSSNRSGWWNYMKDSFLKAYREEFDDRLFELNNTLLHPDNIDRLVDLVTAESNPAEAAASATGASCSFPGRASSFKAFARQRFAIVNRTIANVSVNAGDDQTVFVGATVEFDASATTPAPSDSVTYSWSNGMEGAMPTFVFDEPGDHDITLTVTVRGVEFVDDVRIKVLPVPSSAFLEEDGLVVMEAESFWQNDQNLGEDTFWVEATDQAGFAGRGYMHAVENARETYLSTYVGRAPELRYAILFRSPGTYRVWLRGFTATSRSDTVHVTLDGVARASNEAHEFQVDEFAFTWSGETRSVGPQMLEVVEPGLHYLSVFVRESGLIVDKIVLARDPGFVPEGAGPSESASGRVDGESEPFVRGDANGNERLEIADAADILAHLFTGDLRVECEDHGDFDDDGVLAVTDAIGLLNFLFRAGPAPAPPYPEAGFDLTADANACGNL